MADADQACPPTTTCTRCLAAPRLVLRGRFWCCPECEYSYGDEPKPKPAPTAWKPFKYDDPPEGLFWLEIERLDTWYDVDDYGRGIGGYTGHVDRLVVLAAVYHGEHGPEFDRIADGAFGEVGDDDAVLRYLPLSPPEPPPA